MRWTTILESRVVSGFSLVLLGFLVMPLRAKVEAGGQWPAEVSSFQKSFKWHFLSAPWRHSVGPKEEPQ